MTVPDFDIVGATTVVVPLATMVPAAATVYLRSMMVGLRLVAGGVAGDFGEARFGGMVMSMTSPAAGNVPIIWAPRPWGAVAGVPDIDGTQMIAPAATTSPGVIAVVVRRTGSQLELAVTGFAGLTMRATVRGYIDVFDGAVRLVA